MGPKGLVPTSVFKAGSKMSGDNAKLKDYGYNRYLFCVYFNFASALMLSVYSYTLNHFFAMFICPNPNTL